MLKLAAFDSVFSLPCLDRISGCVRRLSYASKPSLLTRGTPRPSARAAVFEQCNAAFLPRFRYN